MCDGERTGIYERAMQIDLPVHLPHQAMRDGTVVMRLGYCTAGAEKCTQEQQSMGDAEA